MSMHSNTEAADAEVRRAELEEIASAFGPEASSMVAAFEALGWGAREVSVFLRTAASVGSSILIPSSGAGVYSEVVEARKKLGVDVDFDSVKKSGGHVTQVSRRLLEEEKRVLREDFAGLTVFDFRRGDREARRDHPLPAAAHAAMATQIFRRVPRGSRVLEVGPCPYTVVMMAVDPALYRGCVPFLEIKDRERWNAKVRAIAVRLRGRGRSGFTAKQEEIARIVVEEPQKIFFFCKVQEVRWQADYVVSIQSNWNIPVATMPVVMHNIGARAWYASLDNVRGVVGAAEGATGVSRTGMKWEARPSEDRVSFYFLPGASLPYRHRLSVVQEYMALTERTFEVSGRSYVVSESDLSIPSQLVVSCVDVGTRKKPLVSRGRCVARAGPPSLVLKVPNAEVLAHGVEVVGTRDYVVGEDIFSRALADRLMSGAKGDVTRVVEFCRANRVTVTYAGRRVSAVDPVAVEDFRGFAVAVDALARDTLAASSRTADAFREASGFGWAKVFSALAGALASAVGVDSVLRCVRSVLVDLDGAFRHTSVRVERLPRCVYYPPVSDAPVAAGFKHFPATACTCDVSGGGVCTVCPDVGDVLEECASESDDGEFVDAVSEQSSTAVDSSSSGAAVSGSEGVFDVPPENCALGEDEDLQQRHALGEGSHRVVGGFPATRVRLAVEEWVDEMRCQIEANESVARNFFKQVVAPGVVEQHVLSTYDTVTERHVLLDVDANGAVWKCRAEGLEPADFQHVYDYVADKFYNVDVRGGFARVLGKNFSSVLYSNTNFRVWNQPAMIRSARLFLQDGSVLDGREPVLPYTNGVPGCGKTTGVAAVFGDDGRPGGRLFLSSTRSGVDELRKKLFGSVDSREACARVRSYDSLCMWGLRGVVADELVCDEAAVLHPGQLLYVVALVRPVRFRALGDFNQMPHIPFVAGFFPKWPSVEAFCKRNQNPISHRFRASIAAGASRLYGGKVGTCVGCCEHVTASDDGGVEVVRITGPEQVPLQPGVLIIVFTQAESSIMKARVVAAGLATKEDVHHWVCTAAESQGRTVERVDVVRLNKRKKPGSIYFEEKRVNVAMTRAKEKVRYLTACPEENDAVIEFARRSRDPELIAAVKAYSREWAGAGKSEELKRLLKLETITYI